MPPRLPDPNEREARALNAWFAVDRVPGDAPTTAWKRTARLHQARWRQQRGLATGFEPYGGGLNATTVGSRMDLGVARETSANFLSEQALAAVQRRLQNPEPHQMLAEDRLWADLLSSMPMCFNLFGHVFGNDSRAARTVARLWPDAPQGDAALRFEHSPGRLDPQFLGNRSAFDAAFEIATGSDARAIIGVETKYHEHAKRESAPIESRLARYTEVTERSGIFRPDWRAAILGTDLQQLWLDHLLVLAMLQHPSARWAWGRFVLAYPAGNPSFAAASERYRATLLDDTTFAAMTLEEIVRAPDLMPVEAASAFSRRYLDVAR